MRVRQPMMGLSMTKLHWNESISIMKPLIYCDLEVRADTKNEGFALPIMERTLGVLHGVFRQSPDCYAIALPQAQSGERRHPGAVIRVFAETREDLDRLVTTIQDFPVVRDYLMIGYPRSVPVGFNGPWREYRRYRITNRGSRLEKCREFRLQEASKLPYLRVVSRSTGHGFGLYVASVEGSQVDDCKPDSYGLSVATRPFALPWLA
ncbi:conserved hypothetical protein [Gammaproteobacteria bacterium]